MQEVEPAWLYFLVFLDDATRQFVVTIAHSFIDVYEHLLLQNKHCHYMITKSLWASW